VLQEDSRRALFEHPRHSRAAHSGGHHQDPRLDSPAPYLFEQPGTELRFQVVVEQNYVDLFPI
jgi:hypothetical protein